MNAFAEASVRGGLGLTEESQDTFDVEARGGNDSGIREVHGAEADALLLKCANTKKVRGRVVVGKCFLIILFYTALGWSTFSPIFGWTMIDSFYFAMVTVTTVGYGDLTPEDDAGQQIFVAFYAFLGVAFLATILSELSTRIVRFANKIAQRARLESMKQSALLVEQAMQTKHGKARASVGFSVHAKEAQLLAQAVKTAHWMRTNYRVAKRHYGVLVDLLLIMMQIVGVWFAGAAILVKTEGFTLRQSLYCCVITSLSVGYGDYFPVTQIGRLAFAFYIPASVTIVMTCVGQLLAVFRQIRTTHAVKLEPLTKIFSLDADGDGQVSESEYVLFMLAETREVDMAVIAGLKEQFRALDHDKSGGLSREDFPSVLEVQTTSVVYENTIQSVAWKVIPKKSQDKTRISAEEVPARLEPAHGIHLASTAAVKTKPQPLPQVPRSPPRNEPTTVSPIHAKRGVKFNQPSPPRLSRNSSEHSFLSVDLKASNAHQLSEAGGRLWV
jgi:potassium channel subfamily K